MPDLPAIGRAERRNAAGATDQQRVPGKSQAIPPWVIGRPSCFAQPPVLEIKRLCLATTDGIQRVATHSHSVPVVQSPQSTARDKVIGKHAVVALRAGLSDPHV